MKAIDQKKAVNEYIQNTKKSSYISKNKTNMLMEKRVKDIN